MTDTDYSAGAMTPESNAETLGTMLKVALLESANTLSTFKAVNEALYADDIDQAKLICQNFFNTNGQAPGNYNTLTNLQAALYDAIPRDGEPVSGY